MGSGSGLPVSKNGPYEKSAVVVSRKQIAVGLLQDFFFSFQDVPERKQQPFGMLHAQKAQGKVRKTLMAPRTSDVWWNIEANQLPGSFVELIQIYSD